MVETGEVGVPFISVLVVRSTPFTPQFVIIMAGASADEAATPPVSLETQESDLLQMSRVVILELRKGFELDTQETHFDKLGEWCVEGRVQGLGIVPDADGELNLFVYSQIIAE